MPWAQLYAIEWDELFQVEVDEETAAKVLAAGGPIKITDVADPRFPIRPLSREAADAQRCAEIAAAPARDANYNPFHAHGEIEGPRSHERPMLDLSIQVYHSRMDIDCRQLNPKTEVDWLERRAGYIRLIAELQRVVDDGPINCPFAPASLP